ncbi:MAG TPA: 30S ribosomal protein S4 [Lachnospiraceae bacterium]|jgi:small subunit ribosomal protein S4|nr:30S ribosomal protein S4 [Lachnospiraceae bacterium]HBR04724.1 30S ribosomal protein S4 [Lachnospiraceae bacterium]HBZ90344.1 30S ribosomal protein S4 [Lachnospiraceae bacterium]
MARDMGPVLKKCRSLGIEPAVLGISKKSNRKFLRAGKKVSEYGTQLREKQKAKFIYGVEERPFRINFVKAQKLKYGTVGENMLIRLELRLDNVIFRLGFARTRREARQIVTHRHVTVNGKLVLAPSYIVSVNDAIAIKESAKSSQRYKDVLEATNGRLVPAWLTSDREALSGTVAAIPTRDQIDVPVNETAIVELYSK